MSELIKADNEYKEWIAEISTDFRKSQIRASMKVNDEMLRFYWKLGKGISSMSEQFGYGMGFYKTVSDDLKSILPDVKSFSPTNLKYMRYFYEMYPDAVICPQVEDELITDANRPQVGDDLQIIFRIPWGHTKIILDKCKGNSAKALFYIRKTIENNWSISRHSPIISWSSPKRNVAGSIPVWDAGKQDAESLDLSRFSASFVFGL